MDMLSDEPTWNVGLCSPYLEGFAAWARAGGPASGFICSGSKGSEWLAE